mmetsp:Transcript_45127/g.70607  ORF Transcript_45127/g.70607 Transcript_45127/m.70607 type:complete len:253 (-) Transcript_45127:960-1718(-)
MKTDGQTKAYPCRTWGCTISSTGTCTGGTPLTSAGTRTPSRASAAAGLGWTVTATLTGTTSGSPACGRQWRMTRRGLKAPSSGPTERRHARSTSSSLTLANTASSQWKPSAVMTAGTLTYFGVQVRVCGTAGGRTSHSRYRQRPRMCACALWPTVATTAPVRLVWTILYSGRAATVLMLTWRMPMLTLTSTKTYLLRMSGTMTASSGLAGGGLGQQRTSAMCRRALPVFCAALSCGLKLGSRSTNGCARKRE